MKSTLPVISSFIMSLGCAAATAPNAQVDAEFAIVSAKATFAPGDTVSAVLVNRSAKQLGYGACAVALERYEGRKWIHVWPTSDVCISILYVLDGNGSRTMKIPLSPNVASGTYRLRIEVLPETNLPQRNVYSQDFRVQSAV